MIRSTAETRFDFDAPRVNGDGTATISLRCYVGDVVWGQKEIPMSKADVDGVVNAETTPGVSRRVDIYLAFGKWLMEQGILAGEFEEVKA